jgi:pimeloyl-ACP methyl ester carboxylesterase
MFRKQLIAGAAALGLAVAIPVLAAAETGSYAAINGLTMYYQVAGSGPPLVLLHGGVCTIEDCMGPVRAALAQGRQTIAMEQQAHGRTADIGRPLSYDQMAEDTAALLKQLKVENADIVGYSMGGAIALRLALKHPALVRKAVVFGTGYSGAGFPPGFLEGFKTLKADDIPAAFRQAYEKVAPDPKGWPTLIEKIKGLVANAKDMTADDLKAIKAPVLVMIGDADIVRAEHAVEMYRLIPNAKLGILPVSDHFAFVQRADWIAAMTKAFLEAPMPEAKK